MKNRLKTIISILMILTGILLAGCGRSVPADTGDKIGIIGAMVEEL